ncbi:MAG: aspartate kinase [Bacteroidales bacterium]|nr:aspartate kinase [Bacteroidales bacterium]
MLTISQAVEKVVRVKPFIVESLTEGLINISSLARHIAPTVEQMTGKETKSGAIIMALNRLVPHLLEAEGQFNKDMLSMLGDIIVRSNLTDFTFRNSPTLTDCNTRLLEELKNGNSTFYTMVRGVFESTLVVGSDFVHIVEEQFKGEDCTYRTDDLSAITLKLPASNVQAVGFYYQIMKFIAWEGINVKEVISTTNEFSIVVAENDVDRAFALLKNLKNLTKLG